MKVKYYEDKHLNHYEIRVVAHPVNKKIAEYIVDYIHNQLIIIEAFDEYNNKYPITLLNICYFETIDHKVFCYTEKNVYRIRGRSIQRLKNLLLEHDFVQINVRTYVNVRHIHTYSTGDGCRREIALDNGDKLIATRRYRDSFDDKMKEFEHIACLHQRHKKE